MPRMRSKVSHAASGSGRMGLAGASEAAGCGVADVTDVVEVKRQVTAAEAARGPIAILINNAGSVESGPFIKADPSVFRAMWNVHLMGAVYATQAVLPGMIERGF